MAFGQNSPLHMFETPGELSEKSAVIERSSLLFQQIDAETGHEGLNITQRFGQISQALRAAVLIHTRPLGDSCSSHCQAARASAHALAQKGC